MYDVTLRRVRETIVVVAKKRVLLISVSVCVCMWGSHGSVCVCLGDRALAYACARVALVIQHATPRHIVICGLSGSTTWFDIIS